MGAELQSSKMHKIHFIIQKEVDFGRALYVVGNIPQLGCWTVERSLKLCWTKDNYWTGFIPIPSDYQNGSIQFKYAVANWDDPQNGKIEWEAGNANRIIENPLDPQHIICQNAWNMERITLNLMVPDEGKNQEYSVIGDCKQLGNWKKSFKMALNKKRNPHQLSSLKLLDNKITYSTYSFSFQIYRAKPKIHYYYIRKSQNSQIQRHPGRKYQVQASYNSHPKCLKISHVRGDTEMYEICNFKQLNYSSVTQNILLGPYLKTPQDFKLLKDQGVTSILSIQTSQDIAMHCLTQDYLIQQSKDNNIQLYNYSIQDMNKKDFLSKCLGAIQLLKSLLNGNKKVYVHCSAGVYRSPQIVVLYLILTNNYTPQQAVEYVKSRHPFARPNPQIVSHALQILSRSKQLNSYAFQS